MKSLVILRKHYSRSSATLGEVMDRESRVWLIIGASGGFGRAVAEALAERGGDAVAGTVRTERDADAFRAIAPGRTDPLLMDVTRPSQVTEGVDFVRQKFGRIDVLLFTAGYGLLGAVEEVDLEEARAQFETNFFGSFNVLKAVVPVMRSQRSGHIVQISAAGGFSATPGFSIYDASKAALESMCESLAQEMVPFGVKVTIVEPGPFRTLFARKSLKRSSRIIDDYASTTGSRIRFIQRLDGRQEGDPHKAAEVIIAAVESSAPPLRLPLGRHAVESIRKKLAATERDVATWEQLGLQTVFSAPSMDERARGAMPAQEASVRGDLK